MIELTHWHYVGFAYAAAAIVVFGAILAVALDHRSQKRALERLESRGVRRRASARPDARAASPVLRP